MIKAPAQRVFEGLFSMIAGMQHAPDGAGVRLVAERADGGGQSCLVEFPLLADQHIVAQLERALDLCLQARDMLIDAPVGVTQEVAADADPFEYRLTLRRGAEFLDAGLGLAQIGRASCRERV